MLYPWYWYCIYQFCTYQFLYVLFLSQHRVFMKIDYILTHRASLNKFQALMSYGNFSPPTVKFSKNNDKLSNNNDKISKIFFCLWK